MVFQVATHGSSRARILEMPPLISPFRQHRAEPHTIGEAEFKRTIMLRPGVRNAGAEQIKQRVELLWVGATALVKGVQASFYFAPCQESFPKSQLRLVAQKITENDGRLM